MKPRTTLHIIIFTVGIVFLIGYFFVFIFFFPKKETDTICEGIEILIEDQSDIQLINKAGIISLISSKNLDPTGKPLKEIKTEAIETVLKNNKFIKTAESYLTSSGNMRIKVSQRVPKFRVVGFSDYYIDSEKVKIPIVENYTAYLPVVSGVVTEEFATGELFDFISFLEKNEFWNAQIEQINVLNNNEIEFSTRIGDAIVYMGKLDNYKTKLDKLQKLYVEGFNLIGWERYKKIDLQYDGQIVCTKK